MSMGRVAGGRRGSAVGGRKAPPFCAEPAGNGKGAPAGREGWPMPARGDRLGHHPLFCRIEGDRHHRRDAARADHGGNADVEAVKAVGAPYICRAGQDALLVLGAGFDGAGCGGRRERRGGAESPPLFAEPAGQWERRAGGGAPLGRVGGDYASEGSIALQAATRPFTASTDLSIIACSAGSRVMATTRSMPPAPITVGTPT